MKKKIAIFAGRDCREEKREYYFNRAYDLGARLAKANFTVITGAGPGLMHEALRGAQENDGDTIGIALDKDGKNHSSNAKKLYKFFLLGPRQNKLISLSDAYVALPGGIGTLYEIGQVLALKGVGELAEDKPMIIIDDYYSGLRKLYDYMMSEGFISKRLYDMVSFVKAPQDCVDILTRYFR
ncbi:LOG family protein [Candidatus Roizmanbacteria bacterium]|nr:LOG family protein [Candidatus Roizmanbacteria bacterium]